MTTTCPLSPEPVASAELSPFSPGTIAATLSPNTAHRYKICLEEDGGSKDTELTRKDIESLILDRIQSLSPESSWVDSANAKAAQEKKTGKELTEDSRADKESAVEQSGDEPSQDIDGSIPVDANVDAEADAEADADANAVAKSPFLEEVYTGPKVAGIRHGTGTLKFSNGSIYGGDFEAGMRSGAGTFTRPDGYIYVGEWRCDRRNGEGTETLPNGEVYRGKFFDDIRHGAGSLVAGDGVSSQMGVWRDGRKIDGIGWSWSIASPRSPMISEANTQQNFDKIPQIPSIEGASDVSLGTQSMSERLLAFRLNAKSYQLPMEGNPISLQPSSSFHPVVHYIPPTESTLMSPTSEYPTSPLPPLELTIPTLSFASGHIEFVNTARKDLSSPFQGYAPSETKSNVSVLSPTSNTNLTSLLMKYERPINAPNANVNIGDTSHEEGYTDEGNISSPQGDSLTPRFSENQTISELPCDSHIEAAKWAMAVLEASRSAGAFSVSVNSESGSLASGPITDEQHDEAGSVAASECSGRNAPWFNLVMEESGDGMEAELRSVTSTLIEELWNNRDEDEIGETSYTGVTPKEMDGTAQEEQKDISVPTKGARSTHKRMASEEADERWQELITDTKPPVDEQLDETNKCKEQEVEDGFFGLLRTTLRFYLSHDDGSHDDTAGKEPKQMKAENSKEPSEPVKEKDTDALLQEKQLETKSLGKEAMHSPYVSTKEQLFDGIASAYIEKIFSGDCDEVESHDLSRLAETHVTDMVAEMLKASGAEEVIPMGNAVLEDLETSLRNPDSKTTTAGVEVPKDEKPNQHEEERKVTVATENFTSFDIIAVNNQHPQGPVTLPEAKTNNCTTKWVSPDKKGMKSDDTASETATEDSKPGDVPQSSPAADINGDLKHQVDQDAYEDYDGGLGDLAVTIIIPSVSTIPSAMTAEPQDNWDFSERSRVQKKQVIEVKSNPSFPQLSDKLKAQAVEDDFPSDGQNKNMENDENQDKDFPDWDINQVPTLEKHLPDGCSDSKDKKYEKLMNYIRDLQSSTPVDDFDVDGICNPDRQHQRKKGVEEKREFKGSPIVGCSPDVSSVKDDAAQQLKDLAKGFRKLEKKLDRKIDKFEKDMGLYSLQAELLEFLECVGTYADCEAGADKNSRHKKVKRKGRSVGKKSEKKTHKSNSKNREASRKMSEN